MFKPSDFNLALKERSALLKSNGIKKISPRLYLLPGNVTLQFVLSKWGWTPEEGSEFVVRLRNRNLEDQAGNIPFVDGTTDITVPRLLGQGLLDARVLRELDESYPVDKKGTTGMAGWYRFYGLDDLTNLLDVLLPHILKFALGWSEEQNSPQHVPQPIKRMSQEEWEKVQKNLDDSLPQG